MFLRLWLLYCIPLFTTNRMLDCWSRATVSEHTTCRKFSKQVEPLCTLKEVYNLKQACCHCYYSFLSQKFNSLKCRNVKMRFFLKWQVSLLDIKLSSCMYLESILFVIKLRRILGPAKCFTQQSALHC